MQSLFAVQQGSLTIAAMPSFAEGRLPALLASFHTAFPNIKMRIMDVVMEEVIESVQSGRAEIGFTFMPERLEGLYFEPLFDDAFIAVVPQGHSFATLCSVSWSQVFEYPFVAMNRNSSVRNWIELIAAEKRQVINLVAEANQLGTVGQLVGQGMGVSIVPQLCERQMLAKGLVCLPMREQHLVKPVGMIRTKRDPLSVAADALWQSIINEK
jgi:LysR family carnitine catabolism transcriptional activator